MANLNLTGCDEGTDTSILALEGYEELRKLGVEEPDLRPGAVNYIKFRDAKAPFGWLKVGIAWLKS